MVRLSTGKPKACAACVSATIAGLSVEVMSLMPPLRVESDGSSTAAAIAPPTQASTISQRSDTTTPASAYARREPGRPEAPGVLSMVTGVTSRTLARLPGPARRARRTGLGDTVRVLGGGRDGDRQLLALARPGSGMPHFCRAALVAGLVTELRDLCRGPHRVAARRRGQVRRLQALRDGGRLARRGRRQARARARHGAGRVRRGAAHRRRGAPGWSSGSSTAWSTTRSTPTTPTSRRRRRAARRGLGRRAPRRGRGGWRTWSAPGVGDFGPRPSTPFQPLS